MSFRLSVQSVRVRIAQKGKKMNHSHNIIRIISPSQFGGETKNQDRAVFDRPSFTACICDGVTSSPCSGQAASMVSRYCPLLFNADMEKNLEMISNLLVAHRNHIVKTGVKADRSVPDALKDLVQESARERLKNSFQTTLVTVGFEFHPTYISAKTISCGDSGFFAISPTGELMATNLADMQENPQQYQNQPIAFGPGSELLTQIMGKLSGFPDLVKKTSVGNPDNMFVCRTIILCNTSQNLTESGKANAMPLYPNELLLVPKYLVSISKDSQYRNFCRLLYSRFIRRVSSPITPQKDFTLDLRGNITAVLPDHYYTGRWQSLEERYPLDTHFLLCSDGFYRVFPNLSEIWNWLKTNQANLSDKIQKEKLLTSLHCQLNQKNGDDDISFIWITPKESKESIHVIY